MADQGNQQQRGAVVGGRLHGELSEDEVRQELIAAIQPAAHFGFVPETLTVADVTAAGHTLQSFKKLVSILKNVDSDELALEIHAEALRANKAQMFGVPTLRNIFEICSFMCSNAGKAVSRVHKKLKLLSKADAELSVADVSLIQVFDTMNNDYSVAVKTARVEHDIIIDGLRCKLKQAEADKEAALSKFIDDFFPVSTYQGIEPADLNLRCYEIYEAVATLRNERVLARVAGGYAAAVAFYGDKVRKEHKLEFINTPENRPILEEYLVEKIQNLRASRDTHGAQSFLALLTAINPEMVVLNALTGQAQVDELNTGRDTASLPRDAVQQEIGGGDTRVVENVKAAAGGTDQTRPAQEQRTSRGNLRRQTNQPQNQGPRGRGRGRTSRGPR